MIEGVNSTMIQYKNFCKCHNVPPVQPQYKKILIKINKMVKKIKHKEKTDLRQK
jgi:hypothetical protein